MPKQRHVFEPDASGYCSRCGFPKSRHSGPIPENLVRPAARGLEPRNAFEPAYGLREEC